MVLVPLFTFRKAVAVVVSVSLKNIPCCLYLVAPLFPCLWNIQFNQTKWWYFWARSEHRFHSSSGLFYIANNSGRTGFPLSSQWSGWVSTCEYFPICRKKEAGDSSVTPASYTPTVCYCGKPCANAIFLAIYQNAGCHATIPCVVIKRIQTQMQLL